MRVSKWLMKKGAVGINVRSMIKAYYMQKDSDPNVSDREIFKGITKCRYKIIGNNIDPVFVGIAAQPKTLPKYLKRMIVYERLSESIDSVYIIGGFINEICYEEVN